MTLGYARHTSSGTRMMHVIENLALSMCLGRRYENEQENTRGEEEKKIIIKRKKTRSETENMGESKRVNVYTRLLSIGRRSVTKEV